ncbi:hypothetical protein CAPTEDRAFT_45060, partial [Capitella teleta]
HAESPQEHVVTAGMLFVYYMWTYVGPAILGLIFVVGVIGNSLVITVILSKQSMRTVTNFLLLNLAVADMAFLVVCIPFTAHKFITMKWIFGDTACKVVQYFVYVTAYITVYTLVAISALRYMTIVWSTQTQFIRTKRNVIVFIVSIWTATFGANIPVMLLHEVKYPSAAFSYCGLERNAVEPLFLTFFILSYALPLIAIILLYVLILFHLRQQKSMLEQTRERTNHVFRIIVAVIAVFAFTWLPHHVNSLVSVYGALPTQTWYQALRVLWYCMAYGNSCANPLIYNYGSQEFRKSFKEAIFCKYFKRPNVSGT